MGQAVGTSTARGERPKDRPYTVPQVLSTLYRAMGIDPARPSPTAPAGRCTSSTTATRYGVAVSQSTTCRLPASRPARASPGRKRLPSRLTDIIRQIRGNSLMSSHSLPLGRGRGPSDSLCRPSPSAADTPVAKKAPPRSSRCRCPRRPRCKRSPLIPPSVALKGSDSAQQLVLTANLAGERAAGPDRRCQVRGRRQRKVVRVTAARPRHSARQRHAPRSSPSYGDKPVKVAVKAESRRARTCRSTSATRSCRSSPSSVATAAAATARPSGQNGFTPVAARLRAGSRLPDPGEGRPRPAALPGRARPQPAAAQGDRQHGPRRRQAHGGRTPTNTS